jgi:Xaa-Pro dipeptidase
VTAVVGQTGAGMAPAFPAEEYDTRLDTVRRAMDERGLGALLLASPEDVYYVVGLNHMGHFSFTLLILPLEGQPILVTRAMERPTVESQTPHCAHAPYDDDEEPAAAVVAALRALGPTAGSVGVQRTTMYLPVDVWERVRSQLTGVRWTDASDLVERLRMVKSPSEIAYVRRAAAISDRALRAGLEVAGAGVTEREVAAAIHAELIAAGSETPGCPPFVRSTPTLRLEHVTWGDRALEHGDTLFVELSGSVARYHAPVSRMVHVGAPPSRLDEVAADSLTAFDALRAALRPGAIASDVYAAWHRVLDRRLGHSNYRRHHCGYVIGIGFPPSWFGGSVPMGLRAGQDLVVRERMTFHVFSWILGQRPVDYGVSDTALVTPDGSELLTSTAREPMIVGRSHP